MNHVTTTKDRHKKKHYTCNKCYSIFERQVRYQTNKPILCRSCQRKQRHAIQSYPTKKLKEIINNNGVSEAGTDYEERLTDIKEEYYRRNEIIMQKAFDKQNTEY